MSAATWWDATCAPPDAFVVRDVAQRGVACERVLAYGDVTLYGVDAARNLALVGVRQPMALLRWIDAASLTSFARHCVDDAAADPTRPYNLAPVLAPRRSDYGAVADAMPDAVATVVGVGARRTTMGVTLACRLHAADGDVSRDLSNAELVTWLAQRAPLRCELGAPPPPPKVEHHRIAL